MKTSYELVNDPFGTAFTLEEREEFNLAGILPPFVQSIEQQSEQAYGSFRRKDSLIEKRHYFMDIFSRKRTLFYHMFSEHIVYDPVAAESIKNCSEFYAETFCAS